MDKPVHYPRRQKGVIAVLFGLAVIALFLMGGLVLDLGHLYVAKAELQNAADSAALAGAKDLNESAQGITDAVTHAKQMAQKNNFNFSTSVELSDANITFGSSPDGPWFSAAQASAAPQGKTFIKIDTGTKTMNTYLMRVAAVTGQSGMDTIGTSGVSVAGRFVVDVTPLGVCAISSAPSSRRLLPDGRYELVELGFRRGMTYNIPELGPLGATGVPILLNPVDSGSNPCVPSHSSASFTAPFVCQGNSAITNNVTSVYANTGYSAGQIEKAFNSRLDMYPGGTACDPSTAPPDTNVKSYAIAPVTTGSPAVWMAPDPTRQSATFPWPAAPVPSNYGVLWSYSPAVQANGTGPNYSAGAPFLPADWPTLYPGLTATSYPTSAGSQFPAGTPAAPYNQPVGSVFSQQPVAAHPGVRGRRVMNVVIVDCGGLGGGGLSCASLPVKGIGKFFLQAPVDLTGGTKKIYAEFGGLIEPVPASEIKLYR